MVPGKHGIGHSSSHVQFFLSFILFVAHCIRVLIHHLSSLVVLLLSLFLSLLHLSFLKIFGSDETRRGSLSLRFFLSTFFSVEVLLVNQELSIILKLILHDLVSLVTLKLDPV